MRKWLSVYCDVLLNNHLRRVGWGLKVFRQWFSLANIRGDSRRQAEIHSIFLVIICAKTFQHSPAYYTIDVHPKTLCECVPDANLFIHENCAIETLNFHKLSPFWTRSLQTNFSIRVDYGRGESCTLLWHEGLWSIWEVSRTAICSTTLLAVKWHRK